MISRYRDVSTKNTVDGKEVYASLLPTSVYSDLNDLVITVNEMTRLDLLASRYLGNASLWWAIAQVNGIARGSMHATPGSQIIIPLSILSE